MVENARRKTAAHRLVRALWWLAFIFTVVILVGSLPGYWAQIHRVELVAGFSEVQLAAQWTGVMLSIGCAVLCLGLAALLFFRKPDDRMALYLSFYLILYGNLLAGPLEHFVPYWAPAAGDLVLFWQGILFPLPTLALFLIFPNGHFVPRWTRWMLVACGGIMLYWALTLTDWSVLIRINTSAAQFGYVLIGALFLAALGVQIYRYFRLNTPLERQQTKWVILGFAVSYGLLAIVSIPYTIVQNLPPGAPVPWWDALGGLGWWLGLIIQPTAFTIAILRARLWDIDIIIRRTLTYGLVTALLLVVFFGSVIVLQQVFAGLTGSGQNEIVTVFSTLAIAALFVPVRNWMQNAIDRRFNRKKYDAQKVLADFANTVRDETDLEKLTARLMQVVGETMEPKSVSVWLRGEKRRQGEK
ncbi:MAG: hypothetical protein IT331_05175 [Anaerolineae bacterium]|nr:hypothetical protein [Anaerolineae bacterium]